MSEKCIEADCCYFGQARASTCGCYAETIPTDTPAGQGELREKVARIVVSAVNSTAVAGSVGGAMSEWAVDNIMAPLPGPDAGLVEAVDNALVEGSPAIENLRGVQRQLDMDGCEVGVSRQAVDETLAALDHIASALSAHKEGK